jgi:hypothetical protein
MKNIGSPFNFEDTYAHGKRLFFIKNAIEEYCQNNRKTKEEIKILNSGGGTGIGLLLSLPIF